MTKPSTPTKAELHEMLAEAVRNTQPQPQPVDKQPEPVRNTQPEPVRSEQPAPARDTQPAPKRNPGSRKKPAPKRTAKTKSVRASAGRKR